jgi:DNA-directed RNA polymerase subunit M/transcription elongation factor TFIIS
MKNFCENCNNLLEVTNTNDELLFKCMSCFSTYKSEPDDTLRYEETKTGNLIIFQTILNKASKDDMNIREFIACPKCKYNKAKRVRLGSELRLINICEKCNFQWIEMN